MIFFLRRLFGRVLVEQVTGFPAELWPAANIDFGACKLSSGTFVYNYVTVKRVTEPVETITKKMSARLLERRAQRGDELKKVLQAAMGEEFGKEYTTRAFNDAYGACYKRTRAARKKENNQRVFCSFRQAHVFQLFLHMLAIDATAE